MSVVAVHPPGTPDSLASSDIWDCLIIGAGPAGVTAAIQLARRRRRVALVDARYSTREVSISHDYQCLPDGMSATSLVQRLWQQLAQYQVQILPGTVEALRPVDRMGFAASVAGHSVCARTIILATGAARRWPDIQGLSALVHHPALRWSPHADAHEIADQVAAVLAPHPAGLEAVRLLRTHTESVTWFEHPSGLDLNLHTAQTLAERGVRVVRQPIVKVEPSGTSQLVLWLADGESFCVDAFYPLLGSEPETALATRIGVRHDLMGRLWVDEHQCTTHHWLYAIGDTVSPIQHISVGMAQAVVAAIAIDRALPVQDR